ncbi:MAG: ABC transporter substrate-binding protein [Proteobacteria bacterium]|nr:ABC transporter substrate-binding protein [Pseudomonadota bacterium]MBI3498931.1 ABC transporter substrate-binding protein [Pseudomonadota bacterium]
MKLIARKPALIVFAALASGLLLAGTVLVGSAWAQTKYKESPALAEEVKAGKLPAVDARLPEQPLVVPVVERAGQYGGVWRRAFLGPADANNYVRVVYDSLFRFSPDGAKIEPKLAAGAQPSADYKQWTITLRKGSRWSDGAPFTADDIVFWYKDIALNRDLMPAPPPWIRNADGSPALVEKTDTYTVRFTYKEPATLFLTALANADGADRGYAMFQPAHYLKRFHPSYTPKEEVDKLVQAAGFKTWGELFATRSQPPENPDRPSMAAWVSESRISDPVFTLRRNPYYIGVDPEGNQLPYLDSVRFTYFADTQALNLAAIAGDFDMQERHIVMTNYPVFKDQERTGKYRVITWPTFGGADAVLMFNQTYTADPEMGKLMATKEFRVAMSYAINRDQIKESAFLGLGEARQGIPAPWHPYFPGDEWAKKYTEFKPDEANKLLDQIGLTKRDAAGIRLLPNGKPATIEISVVPAFGAWPDVAQLIARDWEKVGIKSVVQIRERALHFTMRDANELMTEIWNEDTSAFPFTGNAKMDVRNAVILTLGPLYTKWLATKGKEGVEPPPPVKRLLELVDLARTVGPDEQVKAAQELFRVWVDNLYEVGIIGLTPMVQGVVVANAKMRNIPTTLGNDWPLRSPGNARTEQFFLAR